jgi:fibronectin type 3 domain-containing protein
VSFSPQSTGAASGAITFTSNATPSNTVESLTATGAPPTVHTVSLSWMASTSNDVVGYNIYRATFSTSCGSYARLNSELNPSTSYSDSTVTDGATYCYVTTAVSSSNEESAYSTAVKVSIPAL